MSKTHKMMWSELIEWIEGLPDDTVLTVDDIKARVKLLEEPTDYRAEILKYVVEKCDGFVMGQMHLRSGIYNHVTTKQGAMIDNIQMLIDGGLLELHTQTISNQYRITEAGYRFIGMEPRSIREWSTKSRAKETKAKRPKKKGPLFLFCKKCQHRDYQSYCDCCNGDSCTSRKVK